MNWCGHNFINMLLYSDNLGHSCLENSGKISVWQYETLLLRVHWAITRILQMACLHQFWTINIQESKSSNGGFNVRAPCEQWPPQMMQSEEQSTSRRRMVWKRCCIHLCRHSNTSPSRLHCLHTPIDNPKPHLVTISQTLVCSQTLKCNRPHKGHTLLLHLLQKIRLYMYKQNCCTTTLNPFNNNS